MFIREKPNAKKPLAILIERHEDGREVYSHPYEVEIETFQPSEEHIAHNVKVRTLAVYRFICAIDTLVYYI